MKKLIIYSLLLSVFEVYSQNIKLNDSLQLAKQIEKSLFYYEENKLDSAKIQLINTIIKINRLSEKYPKNAFLIEQKVNSFDYLSSVYYSLGDYKIAVAYADSVLRHFETQNDTFNIALSYNNIAFMYQSQKLFDNAEKYFLYAFSFLENYETPEALQYKAIILNNLGLIYENQAIYNKGIEYYENALNIRRKIKDIRGISESLNNLGNVYRKLGDNEKALQFLLESEKIKIEIKDYHGLTFTYTNIAIVYYLLNKNELSIQYALKGYELSKKSGNIENIAKVAEQLSRCYERVNNHTEALKYYKEFNLLKDSVMKTENRKALYKHQVNYEYEKKEVQLKAEQEKKDLLAQEEIKRQKLILYSALLVLAFILVSLGFIYRGYLVKKKLSEELANKNEIVMHQKKEVEEKNHEILQSITYAKRLQQSILPPPRVVKEYMAESFILYLPKDIVAGDFYWLESVDGKVYFAAADCTGHGVPGAMVAMVCYNALNRALLEFKLTKPALILDKVNEFVEDSFSKGENEVKDGMDISICCLDKENMTLQWAGANNPLWVVTNSEVNNPQLIEYKPDKQPVGKIDNRHPFTNHEIKLNHGDTIYIFTDGYADQFGGIHGKKYTYKRLRDLFIGLNNQTLSIQKDMVLKEFDDWKNIQEQVDDICVIGVRV